MSNTETKPRGIRSVAEFSALLDSATKAERAEIIRTLQGWHGDANRKETKAVGTLIALAFGAAGFLAILTQVLAIVCR